MEKENNIVCESADKENDSLATKKKSSFKKGILIYSAVLLVLCVAALTVLWIFLDSYQKSDAESAAETAVKELSEDQWKDYFETAFFISDFENKEHALNVIYDRFVKDKGFVCTRRAAECTDVQEVYAVSNGEMVFCKLVLNKSGSGAFGFKRWRYEKLAPSGRDLSMINGSITVLMPKEGTLYVNGMLADLKSAEESACPFDVPGEAEPTYCLFSFKKPWTEFELNAEYKGLALSLADFEGYDYTYAVPDELRYDCTVIVPAGTELYLDGERLTLDQIIENGAKYPYISPLEEKLENAHKATVYRVEGLYREPALKAIYNGTVLEGESVGEEYIYPLPFETHEYKMLAPCDAKVYVNGVLLGEEYVTLTDIVYEKVEKYKDLLVNPKTICEYTVKGLLYTPEIEVFDCFGEPCALESTGNNSLSCSAAPNPQLAEEYNSFTHSFAVAMIEYSMESPELISENMAEALSFTKENSDAYNVIKDAYMAVYWQKAHTLTYNSLYTDNYISYGDNAFSCDIHYDVTGVRTETPSRIDRTAGVYSVLCIEIDGRLKIVDLVLTGAEEKSA